MSLNTMKVLVIEPEESSRENFCEILLYEGFTVYTAASYDTGLHAAHEHIPHLIVLPYQIGDQTGEAFVQALQADPVTASICTLVYGFAKHLSAESWQPKHFLAAYYTATEFLQAVAEAMN